MKIVICQGGQNLFGRGMKIYWGHLLKGILGIHPSVKVPIPFVFLVTNNLAAS